MRQLQIVIPTNDSRGAMFSACRTYRYALWRHWDWQGYANCVGFIGLNPSTADETQDDPTIRRCINFAKTWGYGGIYMLNIFAFRETSPAAMKRAADPVGPRNDEMLDYYAHKCGLLVACWGTHGEFLGRGDAVRRLPRVGRNLHYLRLTADGHPSHPLYLPKTLTPIRWEFPEVTP